MLLEFHKSGKPPEEIQNLDGNLRRKPLNEGRSFQSVVKNVKDVVLLDALLHFLVGWVVSLLLSNDLLNTKYY